MARKHERAYRPTVQSLEGRAVPSFSFKQVLHSFLPFVKQLDTKPTTATAAQRAHALEHRKEVLAHLAEMRAARVARMHPLPGTGRA